MKPSVRIIFGLAIAALTCVAVWSVWSLLRPLPITKDVTVHITRRTSISGAVDSINAACQLHTPLLVRWTARLASRILQRPILHGWYVFKSSDSQWDVILSLLGGRSRASLRVTLPEGLTYREMAGVLQHIAEIDSAAFVDWCESDSVTHIYADESPSMEGYLMPDTYNVNWRDDASAVGDRLAAGSRKFWSTCATTRSRHEVLTLASIVQAEAAAVSEMPRIAGVYSNRLARGIKLEADPTVQYGRGVRSRVLYRHLQEEHAYNTYVHLGLPLGPIGNPGADAIRAALAPERHTFMFFVAKGDGSGLHRFARTGAEHLANVRLYRMMRR